MYCIGYHWVATVQPVVFGAPLPLDPVAPAGVDLPTAGQLATVLNTLQDPSVSFANKGYLVEGGIPFPAVIADHELQKAASKGSLPLTFNFTSITPAGPGTAAAVAHRDGSAPRPDVPEPHVRQPGRLEAVARLGDDADTRSVRATDNP